MQRSLLLILASMNFFANGQTDLTVEYGEIYSVVSFKKQRDIKEYNRKHLVYINGDSISFCSYNQQKADKKENTVGSKKDHHATYLFPKLSRYLGENHWIKPYNLLEYEVRSLKWVMHSDTLRVADYLCKVAVADGVVAWFTEEIPVQFGPASYNGLPGLIILLEDHRYNRIYKMISLEKESPKIILPELPLKACNDCDSKLKEIKGYFAD